ncbi:MAG TPA: hypothetical protein VGA33_12385 [Thermoanaerobaculia bacterium]
MSMSKTKQFAVCIKNEGAKESLELRKIYEILEDPAAEKRNFVRVIDEEGEDYLYPKAWFLPLDLPQTVEDTLLEIAHS